MRPAELFEVFDVQVPSSFFVRRSFLGSEGGRRVEVRALASRSHRHRIDCSLLILVWSCLPSLHIFVLKLEIDCSSELAPEQE